MIKQFVNDVYWEDLDYLVIDTPPGLSLNYPFNLIVLKSSYKIVTLKIARKIGNIGCFFFLLSFLIHFLKSDT